MITLHVNGQAQSFDGDPSMPVLWYLRDVLGLTGTKFGCGVAACGACTIHLDGDATRSCQTQMSDANGKSVTTIEGLGPDGEMGDLQQAMWDSHSFQCGFCTPGMVVQATAFLSDHPDADEQQIREALSGNICRCTGYQRIIDGVLLAAGRIREREGS